MLQNRVLEGIFGNDMLINVVCLQETNRMIVLGRQNESSLSVSFIEAKGNHRFRSMRVMLVLATMLIIVCSPTV